MKLPRVLMLVLIPAQCWSGVEHPAGCAAAFVLRNKQVRNSAQGLRDMAAKVMEDQAILPEGFSGTLFEVCIGPGAAVLQSEACEDLEDIALRTTKKWPELSSAQRLSLVNSWSSFLRALASEVDAAAWRPCGIKDEGKAIGRDCVMIGWPISLPILTAMNRDSPEASEAFAWGMIATPFMIVLGVLSFAGDVVTAPPSLVAHALRQKSHKSSPLEAPFADFVVHLPAPLNDEASRLKLF